MKTLPAIVPATWADIDTAATVIADAFACLDAAAWLVPDPDQRPAVLRGHVRILVEHALFFGQVDILDDRSAVAVWFNRTRPVPPPADYDNRLPAACGAHTARFEHLDSLFDTHHPSQAHEHLAFLAVTPGLQRTGRGSALLRHHHAELDRAGVPAYLEASSPASRDLYRRHGYHQLEAFTLPDGTPFWRMWRPPTGTTAIA